VERGEYVRTSYEGRALNPETEVPFKSIHSLVFELDSRLVGGRKTTMMPVIFGGDEPTRNSAVLVDFDRGPVKYEKSTSDPKNGKSSTREVTDKAGTEILMVKPDGKVVARNSAIDDTLTERNDRYKGYLKRIKEIKDAKSGPPMPPPGTGPAMP